MDPAVGQMGKPQTVRPEGFADVVICIDCTQSMAPCIAEVKQHVEKLVEGFEEDQKLSLKWRVRLMEYRDLNIGEPVQEYPFTSDIEEFRTQVRGLSHSGGGDEPESTLDAIYRALRSEWRENCNRCIVIFTDATCHTELHPSTVDAGQARDDHEVINLLLSLRARLFLFAPSFHIYDELARQPRVQYKKVVGAKGLEDVNIGKLLAGIGKTVSATTEPVKKA